MIHCKDCLAYYSEGFNHVCPPWLKMLVKRHKNKEKEQKIAKKAIISK